MNHESIQTLLDEFVDGTLSPEDALEVSRHLQSCARCREEVDQIRSLLQKVSTLPASREPDRDLWSGIQERIQYPYPNVLRFQPTGGRTQGTNRTYDDSSTVKPWKLYVSIAAAVIFAAWSFLLVLHSPGKSFEVASLQGNPLIGGQRIGKSGHLEPGNWLVTDAHSRAQLTVADIGHVEIGPNSRLRLLRTREDEHRLELERGRMHAKVWSPPRIFIVETPSATAIDLGCSYNLVVDSTGAGQLVVLTGEVSLESRGRESYVPAGSCCETQPGHPPGTPYSGSATPEFLRSLHAFDFEDGGGTALETILQLADKKDAITLWHLLARVNDRMRGRVFDRLALLVEPPAGVTKDGIMQLKKSMLDEWLDDCSDQTSSLSQTSPDY